MIVGTCDLCKFSVLDTDARITAWYTCWHTHCWNEAHEDQADERAEREWDDAQEYAGNRCPERE